MDEKSMDYNTVQQFKEILRKNKARKCYLADNSCSTKIADCHSIQNNKILKRISENGMVVCFTPDLEAEDIVDIFQNRGRKIASIFNGFCGKHDEEIFRDIDQNDYQIGNARQDFLFALRALTKELWNKETVVEIFKSLKSKNLIPDQLDNFFQQQKREFEEGIKGLKEYLDRFLAWNKTRNYENIKSFCFTFPDEYLFAVSSFFTPYYDFNGNIINDFSKQEEPKAISLTIFPQEGRTYVLFSYLSANTAIFKDFENYILELNNQNQKKVLNNLTVAYTDNFVISPKIWDSFSDKGKKDFASVFFNTAGSFPNDKNFLLANPSLDLFQTPRTA